jgi:hypothetical protein
VEYEIWGLNSTVNHAFNLLYYGLIGFFTFLFTSKLLRGFHPANAIIATLLFIVHPIHLEVVANIKSRDTMLGNLNLMLALLLLLVHVDGKKWWPFVLSVGFYAIGLFSKEEVLTALALIPAMLWFFRGYRMGQALLKMVPYLAVALIYLAVRSNIVGGLNAGVKLTALDNSLLAANGFAERTASNALVLGKYLLMTVFPHPLVSDYSYSTLPVVGWGDWRAWFGLLANLGLAWWMFKGFAKRQLYSYGILHYFVSVSMFTSIIITNVSAYNDRFLFTPVLGICMVLAWAIMRLSKKTQEAGTAQFFKNNFVVVAIVAGLVAASVAKVERHLPTWRDRFALFEHDARLTPNNARTRKNHGGSLALKAVEAQEKDPNMARQYATKAITELEAALGIYDQIPTGHIHKGNMHIILGEYDKAETSLKKALSHDRGNYFAKTSLGNVLFRVSKYQECVQVMESIPERNRKPQDYYMLSLCYDKVGNSERAAARSKSGR